MYVELFLVKHPFFCYISYQSTAISVEILCRETGNYIIGFILLRMRSEIVLLFHWMKSNILGLMLLIDARNKQDLHRKIVTILCTLRSVTFHLFFFNLLISWEALILVNISSNFFSFLFHLCPAAFCSHVMSLPPFCLTGQFKDKLNLNNLNTLISSIRGIVYTVVPTTGSP